MVDVASMIANIAFAIYSMIVTFDKEQCGGEWIKPDVRGKYLPVISDHY